MLPKLNRLPMHNRLVPSVTVHSDLFSLKARESGLPYSRFAFVVSKRVDTRSTARNSTKRAYRACIQSHLNEVSTGYDMLFILKKTFTRDEAKELCPIVLSTLKKKSLVRSVL